MSEIIALITAIASVISCFGVVFGVAVAYRTLQADHERRKKQSTVEFYNNISVLTAPLREKIKEVFRNGVLDPNSEKYKLDKQLQQDIQRYLSLIEQFSVGINMGVYDLDVFMRIAGRSTIRWYDRLNLIIERKRTGKHKTAYQDFETMVCNMKRLYEKQECKKRKHDPKIRLS